ncbi:MAG TPA: hypothetical protein VMW47_03970 [Verrucomicrobiae bacterium]|nr:hypothetical protein [Verrucomicrobiae bacterium]
MIRTLLRTLGTGPWSGRSLSGRGGMAAQFQLVPVPVAVDASALWRVRPAPGPPAGPLRIFGRHRDPEPSDPEPVAGAEGGAEAAPSWNQQERDSAESEPAQGAPGLEPAPLVAVPVETESAELAPDLPDWASPAPGADEPPVAEETSGDVAAHGWSDLDDQPPSPRPVDGRGWSDPLGAIPDPTPAVESPVVESPTHARGWRARGIETSWGETEAAPDVPAGGDIGDTDTALPAPTEALEPEGDLALPAPPVDDWAAPPTSTFGVPDDPALLLRPALTPIAGPDPSAESSARAEDPIPTPEVPPVIDLTPIAPRAEPRAFPLPEGEVVFRNLRTAFTDPSRLLRHLAGDGHTGVLEIISGHARSSYVVLLEGGVVAVALESDGTVRTTNRVGFPAFPDGQDTLNVFRYPPEVARGLGLLLHAPVHFSGLGAVFVDLDGLRTYLEGRRADGGLIVSHGEEVGVALFAAGELVGAYTSGDRALGDLDRIRELVARPDTEIDVRIGGPSEPPVIGLDDLLRDLTA